MLLGEKLAVCCCDVEFRVPKSYTPAIQLPTSLYMDIPGVSDALNQRLGTALQIKAARHNKQNPFQQLLKGRRGARLAPESPPKALTWEQKTRHRLRLRSSSTHLGFHYNQRWFILTPIRNRRTL
jgi:hypothetical protein